MKISLRLAIIGLLLLPSLTAAQDMPTRVSLNAITFEFTPDIATNVNVVANPGYPPGTPRPDGTTPPRREFILYGPGGNARLYDAPHTLLVYRVADFAPYAGVGDTSIYDQLPKLQQLLNERPDLAAYEIANSAPDHLLPHLPHVNAPQAMRVRTEYLETDTLTGVRYLTVYPSDTGRPLLADEFVYAFMALSKDGEYLVAGSFTAQPEGFFTTWPPENPADEDAFYTRYGGVNGLEANYDEYVTEQVAPLDSADPASFTPSLDSINALIETIAFSNE